MLKHVLTTLLPRPLYVKLLSPYHLIFNFVVALLSGFPGRKLTVIGVTGTKGKSSVSEMLFHVLRVAGKSAAVSGTIRFAINDEVKANKFKMTMPGHGFLHEFLKEAVSKGAKYAVLELTSEGAVQHRHRFLALNALIFTNQEKEHIESHGSMEAYIRAKFKIGKALARSSKRPRAIIANRDNPLSAPYLALPVEERIAFSIEDASDIVSQDGMSMFTFEHIRFTLPHPGNFSIMNALAVIKTARFLGIPLETSRDALASLTRIPGRAEKIDEQQSFTAIVDYAHTPDSLKALYEAYPGRKICVLGNTGGGRDTWKRPLMGALADQYCSDVILTDEDPYDEDPLSIVESMTTDMKRTPTIIMERRAAIKEALLRARPGDTVLITGKGTDPYIMRANGEKEVWSDSEVVRELLKEMR